MGNFVCIRILFVHALSGCDTAPKVFGIHRNKTLSKLKSDKLFAKQAGVFMNSKSTKENVINAEENALVSLYNGLGNKKLDDLRLSRI